MRYMQSFYRRLRQMREARGLSLTDVADLCGVDESQVERWESFEPKRRAYPSVEEFLDICLRTGTPIDELLDFDDLADAGQLELPGLAFSNNNDLTDALVLLGREFQRLQLPESEVELLRRFRSSTTENRRRVLRLLGNR
ncbi:helix-turn-helix domain-containing protein [Marinobacter caseinilyticus]|uniref:helix-turn-helix domain-containing protein n=1 Tax=Marinobacter caseinilyticus TaxID=2692195 RepID=UPI001409E63A|nr:helix-turn-helix transcriptional regulator [Marinobacter caseinilyticus]